MFHGMTIIDWLPVLVIGFAFLAAGVAFAVLSAIAGQYRDPEAAKYSLLEDDRHPAEETTPVSSPELGS